MENHNVQKKIAVINDLSGFGRCSLTVALPIISAMGIQCCPLPTSILSNHTGYPSYFFEDYTHHMQDFMREWLKLGLSFDGIATGFLGSLQQIELVEQFIETFQGQQTKVIVDPVMGDKGEIYSTYTKDMCREMKRLVSYSHILTPNMTEACILTGTPYKDYWEEEELEDICNKLVTLGAKKIVLSGLEHGNLIGNYIFEGDIQHKGQMLYHPKIHEQRAGTGDVFASVIAGACINGDTLLNSVKKASEFICKAMEITAARGIPEEDGICFEEVLGELIVKK